MTGAINLWFIQLANRNMLPVYTGLHNGIPGSAVFDSNCKRRYFLEKRWKQGGNILTAIMMNPSNAAHNNSDDTVDQLINVAKAQNCNALYVVNISSFIGGSSNKLNAKHFDYEDLNWRFNAGAISEAKIVFIGWGLKGHTGLLKQRSSNHTIVDKYKTAENNLYCYEVLKSMDKRYKNKPMYYVPHPRPLYDKEKYFNAPIQKINEQEFKDLFNR